MVVEEDCRRFLCSGSSKIFEIKRMQVHRSLEGSNISYPIRFHASHVC